MRGWPRCFVHSNMRWLAVPYGHRWPNPWQKCSQWNLSQNCTYTFFGGKCKHYIRTRNPQNVLFHTYNSIILYGGREVSGPLLSGCRRSLMPDLITFSEWHTLYIDSTYTCWFWYTSEITTVSAMQCMKYKNKTSLVSSPRCWHPSALQAHHWSREATADCWRWQWIQLPVHASAADLAGSPRRWLLSAARILHTSVNNKLKSVDKIMFQLSIWLNNETTRHSQTGQTMRKLYRNCRRVTELSTMQRLLLHA